jgi:predicted RNA-binding Zn-ribbon protein involved in translation (DUF1610 family)
MVDALQFLWPAVEAVHPVFARAATVRWPSDVHNQLVSAGLLIPGENATRIRCPECGRTHVARPIARSQPDGSVRLFIPCPEHLRAEVRTRDLQQWLVNIHAVVASLSTSLSLGGQPTQRHSDRVWRCGRWTYQGKMRDVLFARGLRRNDALQCRRAITGSHRPMVFVGSEVPDLGFWQSRVPPLIRLSEVATLIDGRIQIDVTQVIGLVKAADDLLDTEAAAESGKNQRKAIRRAVKEEIKSLVSDDALVAAYKKYGSYAKAAAGLTNEGVPTNRWAVERAVKKAGGWKGVIRIDDSESVVRSRSSQRRDTPLESATFAK